MHKQRQKRYKRLAVLFVAVIAFTVFLHGQKEEVEGKAWLDPNTTPPALNVTGIWDSPEWGKVSLNQREGGRRIIGTGDGWDISGVVSGKDVYLLFCHEGKVGFSAKLTADAPSQLRGIYAKGILSSHSKTRPTRLSK
jgi:hypothetical protein